MIEALGMAGIIAMLCIPAGMIGKAVDKQIRRRDRELRRQQARQDMADMDECYSLLMKGRGGDR